MASFGQMHVLQVQFAGVGCPEGQLPLLVLAAESGCIRRHDESTDRLGIVDVAGLGPDDRHGGLRAVGDPHLGAVEHPAIGGFAGGGDHAGRVRSIVGLGQSEAADLGPGRQLREPFLALFLGAKGIDRVHHERTLHRRERADPAVAALEFLHDQPVGHVVQAGTAVFLGQVGAEEAQLRHARDQFLREAALDVAGADDRHQLFVHPRPDAVPDRPFLLAEQRIEIVEVHPSELGAAYADGHGSPEEMPNGACSGLKSSQKSVGLLAGGRVGGRADRRTGGQADWRAGRDRGRATPTAA